MPNPIGGIGYPSGPMYSNDSRSPDYDEPPEEPVDPDPEEDGPELGDWQDGGREL